MMTDAQIMRYAVLLAKPDALDIPKIGEVLGQFLHIPFAEAAGLARKSWGLVAENFEKAEASSLSGLLQRAGTPALAIPKNLIEELPLLHALAKLELEMETLRAVLKTGGEQRLNSGDLSLIAACAYKQVVSAPVKAQEGPDPTQKAIGLGLSLMTGLPISIGPKKKEKIEVRQQSELVLFLDLYFKGGERLRVDAQDFDYSGLKEGMGYAALENFRTLVERLAKLAPLAVTNRGARVLIDRRPIHGMGYEGLADLEKEARWLLTLKTLALGSAPS